VIYGDIIGIEYKPVQVSKKLCYIDAQSKGHVFKAHEMPDGLLDGAKKIIFD
jgi:hypothetical protein